jgi:hypothetical protein
MKTLLSIALATSLLAAPVFASASSGKVQIRPADSTFETEVCYTAATQGLTEARALIIESGEHYSSFVKALKCNGHSLVRTAKMFRNQSELATTQETAKVKFVTDEAPESQVCLDAIVMGVDAALEKHSLVRSSIICNGSSIETFAKRFSGRTVAL